MAGDGEQLKIDREFRTLFGSALLAFLSFGVFRAVYANFAGQELGIGPGQFGLLEGFRELPGLLTILLAVATGRFPEHRLYVGCTALMAAGIWLYAGMTAFSGVVVATLVMSVGFHLWFIVQEAIVLKEAGPAARGTRLGQLNSAQALALVAGTALVWLLGARLPVRAFFPIAGLAGLAGAALALRLKPVSGGADPNRFVLKRQYLSYYVFNLVEGARRHMVLTFATFALVRIYGTPVHVMAGLMLVHSVMAIYTRPYIGRLVDRLGDLRALRLKFGLVTLVFLGYALVRNAWVAYGLFVLDNVLVGFAIAISTHAARIVPRQELRHTLAAGSTVNHIFGVAIPVFGGVLWEWFGPVVPFLMGAAVVALGAAYAWWLEAGRRLPDRPVAGPRPAGSSAAAPAEPYFPSRT